MDQASQDGLIFIEGSGPTYATVDVSVMLEKFQLSFLACEIYNPHSCLYVS